MEEGNVVKDYKIENTRVRICDDYCRDRTNAEIEDIIARISDRTQKQLSAQEFIKDIKS